MYAYDDYSRVSGKTAQHVDTTDLNVLEETFTYRNPVEDGATSQVETYRTASPAGYDVTYSYTYDGNGNILTVSDGTNTTGYVYDTANQLLRENNQAADKTWGYVYDDAGNILRRLEYGYTTGDLGDPTDTVVYTYGDPEWGDLLTAYDGQTITHDAIGNPLTDGTWTYTWEHGRELASMTDGGTTWDYTYNADGLRTKRTNGTITYNYLYLGGQLVKETIGDTAMYFAYDADGKPMSVLYNDVTYYYVTNLQGDVVAILSNTGELVVSYTYDAWGNLLTTTGSMADTLGTHNPLRYRGYVYDAETGLYYLQSRYYDPGMGRFINADAHVSTGQNLNGYNMFAYCGNNPVIRTDSTGLFWKELWDELVQMVQQASGYFAIAAGVTQIDSPVLGPADAIGAAMVIGGLFVYGTIAVGSTILAQSTSDVPSRTDKKAEALTIAKKPNNPVIFPTNPNEFNPIGLIKVPRAGTKNGAFISWMDPLAKTEVFRWDENPNYPNGPHYHINNPIYRKAKVHFYPGDVVPEPYATIHFPFG